MLFPRRSLPGIYCIINTDNGFLTIRQNEFFDAKIGTICSLILQIQCVCIYSRNVVILRTYQSRAFVLSIEFAEKRLHVLFAADHDEGVTVSPFSVLYIQWNLDLMKYQGTGEICSLYRGSVPYIFTVTLAGLENNYRNSLYQGNEMPLLPGVNTQCLTYKTVEIKSSY